MKKLISKVLSIRSYFIKNRYLFTHNQYLEQELEAARSMTKVALDSAISIRKQLHNLKNERSEGVEHLKNHVSWQGRFIGIHGLEDEYTEYVKTLLADAKEDVTHEYQ